MYVKLALTKCHPISAVFHPPARVFTHVERGPSRVQEHKQKFPSPPGSAQESHLSETTFSAVLYMNSTGKNVREISTD